MKVSYPLNIYSRGDPVGGALVTSGLTDFIPIIIYYHEFSVTNYQ